jgi:hypothetical protein
VGQKPKIESDLKPIGPPYDILSEALRKQLLDKAFKHLERIERLNLSLLSMEILSNNHSLLVLNLIR